MNLRESLHREVADVRADHDELLLAVRGRTCTVHRRRRAVREIGAVLALAALVAAVLAGVSALPRSTGTDDDEATRPRQTAPRETGTVPATGRTAAAVLVDVVGDLDRRGVLSASVVTDSVGGSGDDGLAGEQALAQLALDTAGGEVDLVVNVQRWSSLGLEPGCVSSRTECRTTTLADGDVLTTFAPDDGKAQRQLAAEVVSVERDLRVIVSTTTTGSGTLTREQVAAVAGADPWGLELPARYAAAAAALPSYDVVG